MEEPTRTGVWRDLSAKPRLIRFDTRGPSEYGRSSPRMRFDLLELVAWLLGILLLVLATGEVDERTLRILGVVSAIAGAVWLIEPDAFGPYLATETEHGVRALVLGGALVVASFVPPLSGRRPGVRR